MIFNKEKPRVTVINDIDFNWLINLKLYRLESIIKVYEEGGPLLKQLLDTAPITHKYKRVLVDIKVQDLDINTYSCIRGWHLDGRLSTDNPDKNVYHIFTSGGAPTEFIGAPISLSNNVNQKQLVKEIPDDIEIYPLPENVWNTYSEYDWHRGTNSKEPVRRTFIRICETNYIRAQRKQLYKK